MIVVISLSLLFYLLGFVWLVRIIISYVHIKGARDVDDNDRHIHLDILLPVLNEESRLKSFVEYFESVILPIYPELTIWIITTEQELVTSANPTTWKISDELAAERSYVRRIHYPKQGGVMAHQLNFALESIKTKGLFVVYNADSQPDPQTFKWVNSAFRRVGQKKIIFQQYGNYLRNHKFISKRHWSNTLLANGLHQNRCTLGYEYFKALQGNIRSTLPSLLRPMNYCIGHGLFFTADLGRVMRFSEKSRNEDCIYGLEATWKRIPIIPIPYFDASDSTSSVSSLYYQKSNWFFGPFQAFLYRKILLDKYHLQQDISLTLFSLKLFMQSVGWIFWPLSGLFLFFSGVYFLVFVDDSIHIALMMLFALPFYLIPTSLLSHTLMRKLRVVDNKDTLPSDGTAYRAVLMGSVVSYIISGTAGLYGLLRYKQILRSHKGKTPTD